MRLDFVEVPAHVSCLLSLDEIAIRLSTDPTYGYGSKAESSHRLHTVSLSPDENALHAVKRIEVAAVPQSTHSTNFALIGLLIQNANRHDFEFGSRHMQSAMCFFLHSCHIKACETFSLQACKCVLC